MSTRRQYSTFQRCAVSIWWVWDPIQCADEDLRALKRSYAANAGRTRNAYYFEHCRHELLNELERDESTSADDRLV